MPLLRLDACVDVLIGSPDEGMKQFSLQLVCCIRNILDQCLVLTESPFTIKECWRICLASDHKNYSSLQIKTVLETE